MGAGGAAGAMYRLTTQSYLAIHCQLAGGGANALQLSAAFEGPASKVPTDASSITSAWHGRKKPADLSKELWQERSGKWRVFQDMRAGARRSSQALGAFGLFSLNASISAQIARIEPPPIRNSFA